MMGCTNDPPYGELMGCFTLTNRYIYLLNCKSDSYDRVIYLFSVPMNLKKRRRKQAADNFLN